MPVLGHYPTPVERLGALSTPESELWVKRDDLTHDVYGGNKVRKLEHLLAEAREHGARRLVTVGAVGSHHVLATTYFGRGAGFEVEAVLVPQPRTDRVAQVLRADVALGLRAFPVRSWGTAPLAIARRVARGARFVMVGGSSASGSMGYFDAARELAAQVLAGALPEPDVCVVAVGSGGTAAGLAAGFDAAGLKTRVAGVCVSEPPAALHLLTRHLARACARRSGRRVAFEAPSLSRRLTLDDRFLGRGYGYPSPEGVEAMRCVAAATTAPAAALMLDPTYTAKTFAAALWHVRARQARVVLYWHTLSSAPMAPLLEGAPEESALDVRLRRLMRGLSD